MKKMVMPAIFAFIYIVFVVMYAVMILISGLPLLFKLLIGGLLLITGPLMVYVFIQRYREFKEEQKDDLSKY